MARRCAISIAVLATDVTARAAALLDMGVLSNDNARVAQ